MKTHPDTISISVQASKRKRSGYSVHRQPLWSGGLSPTARGAARQLGVNNQEVLVAYNTSTTESRNAYVLVDSTLHRKGEAMKFLYGKEGYVTVHSHPDPGNSSLCIQLGLAPMEFVNLQ